VRIAVQKKTKKKTKSKQNEMKQAKQTKPKPQIKDARTKPNATSREPSSTRESEGISARLAEGEKVCAWYWLFFSQFDLVASLKHYPFIRGE
jgi:outer membrane biosynthesis protein TonB